MALDGLHTLVITTQKCHPYKIRGASESTSCITALRHIPLSNQLMDHQHHITLCLQQTHTHPIQISSHTDQARMVCTNSVIDKAKDGNLTLPVGKVQVLFSKEMLSSSGMTKQGKVNPRTK